MSRESIARNNANALTGIVGSVAAQDPFGVGAIVQYVATRLAERQLEKIRHPTTEDDEAMALNERTLEIINSRVLKLNNLQDTVDRWRSGRTDASLAQPAPFEPSRTLAQIQAESVTLNDGLVARLPSFRDEVCAFVDAGTGEKTEEGKARALTLRTEYKRLAMLYRLWWRNTQEMQKQREQQEDAMFAEQMDRSEVAQRVREEERRKADNMLRSMGIEPPQT